MANLQHSQHFDQAPLIGPCLHTIQVRMGASRREGLGRGGASEGPKSARPSRRGRGGLVLFAEQTKRASLRYGSSNLGAPQPIWTTATCLPNADRGRCDHAISLSGFIGLQVTIPGLTCSTPAGVLTQDWGIKKKPRHPAGARFCRSVVWSRRAHAIVRQIRRKAQGDRRVNTRYSDSWSHWKS